MKRFMPLAWYRGNIMQQTVKASRARVWLNKLKTTFSKPQNAILLALGILLNRRADDLHRAGYRNRSCRLGR